VADTYPSGKPVYSPPQLITELYDRLPFCSIFMFVVYIQIVSLNGGYISR